MQKWLTTAFIGALTLTIGCGDDTGGDTTPTDEIAAIVALTGDAANGATVYGDNCAGCHGADGTGSAAGPDLSGEIAEHSDEDIVTTIYNGDGSMPEYGTKLSEQEIADVLAHLRDLFG